MDPRTYQREASRTVCDQEAAAAMIAATSPTSVQLMHAVFGIHTEGAELAAAVERWLWYGHGIDTTNFKEELGDLMWYVVLACNALNVDLGQIMEANIRKLRERYPEKFDSELAKEYNRDREAEKSAVNMLPVCRCVSPRNDGTHEWHCPLRLVGPPDAGFMPEEIKSALDNKPFVPRAYIHDDEMKFKASIGLAGCTCKVLDYDNPPTLKGVLGCPVHYPRGGRIQNGHGWAEPVGDDS